MALTLVLAVLTVELGGCGLGRQSRSERRQAALASLSVGMPREQVLSLMGRPQGRQVHGQTEILIYETNRRAADQSERFTQIAIADGRVVGWQRSGAESASEHQAGPDARAPERTPDTGGQVPQR